MAFPVSIDVTCTNGACASMGVVRRVRLTHIAVGVVAIPTMRCAGCAMDLYKVPDGSFTDSTADGMPDGAHDSPGGGGVSAAGASADPAGPPAQSPTGTAAKRGPAGRWTA